MQDNDQGNSPNAVNGSWADKYLPAPGQVTYGTNLIDITLIRGFLWRQRFILGGIVGLALLFGFVSTLLIKPTYQASATVRVDTPEGEIVKGQDISVPYIPSTEYNRHLETLGTVLKSRAMAYLVVDSLKLASNNEFLGLDGNDQRPEGLTAKQWQNERREMAASIVQGGVSVDIPFQSRILTIKYASTNQAIVATVANSYADNFLTDDVRRSLETSSYALKYLEGQIARTRLSLQEAELKAIAYAKANRIVTQAMPSSEEDKGSSSTITVAALAGVNQSFVEARTTRIEAEQRWRAVAQLPAAKVSEVQQSAVIQNLDTDRSRLVGKLSDLRQRYGDTYPEVVEIKAQIASLDREISRIGSEIKSTLESAYRVALRQEQALSKELKGASDQTLDEQDRRVQFGLLDRDAQALREQLASLLERYNQISSAANVKPGYISKLDAAMAPVAPISPNLAQNMMLAFALGLGLAIAVAILRELLDDRLRSAEEVERKLGLPLLGLTPQIPEDQATEEWGPLVEAYSSIRTSIEFALPKREHNVLLVTSSLPSEGKSMSATTIAKRYAQLGRKVLLIDADLRRPSLAAEFGFSRSEKGFVEVMLGDCSLESALLAQPQENLDVLPVGALPANPADVLSSPKMSSFLAKVSQEYALVVIDSPPIMGLADAPLLSRCADGVVFIVESNRAYFGQAKTALRRLREAKANILGVVLTKFRSLESGEGYYYYYSYYRYGEDNP